MSIINNIGCRECDAPTCVGCNIYTLAVALGQGKLDWMMDESGYRAALLKFRDRLLGMVDDIAKELDSNA